ncbi:MAG: hypothetical protein QF618_04610 [SAR324 cluster bacterium]|nr:hypothetical protein [SAR324 cluster bacterium]
MAGSIRLIAICGSVDVQFEEFQTLTVLSRASFRQTLNAERPIDRENSENKAQDLTMKSIARRKHSAGFEIQRRFDRNQHRLLLTISDSLARSGKQNNENIAADFKFLEP